jgi:transposase
MKPNSFQSQIAGLIRFEKRRKAIQLRGQGLSLADVASTLNVHPVTIYKWYAEYKKNGKKSFHPKRPGRRPGNSRILPLALEFEIICDITHNMPDELDLPFFLWSVPAVGALIEKHYQINMSAASLGNYFKRWGIDAPAALPPESAAAKRWHSQRRTIDKWTRKVYPQIVRQARRDNAHVYWGYPRVNLFYQGPRACALHREMLADWGPFNAAKTYGFAAVFNRRIYFMVYQGRCEALTYIRFLERLVKMSDRPVLGVFQRFHLKDRNVLNGWLDKRQENFKLFTVE